jgi:short-subunit dehydrogenase
MIANSEIYGVISGATGFIGKHLAFHYAKLGSNLILIGRDYQKLIELKKDLDAISEISVIVIKLEFEGNFIGQIMDKFDNQLSQISFMINTIGCQDPIGPCLGTSDADWTKSVYVNLIVPVQLTKFFAKIMVKNGSGSIVLFGGGGASSPRLNFTGYSASKAGLARFVETLALELQASNVHLNMVAPGIMPSKMMNQIIESSENAGISEVLKAKSVLDNSQWIPSKVVELCNFLTSNNCGITGKIISAEWDDWHEWIDHAAELNNSDLFTLRRIVGKDRGLDWGAKS